MLKTCFVFSVAILKCYLSNNYHYYYFATNCKSYINNIATTLHNKSTTKELLQSMHPFIADSVGGLTKEIKHLLRL